MLMNQTLLDQGYVFKFFLSFLLIKLMSFRVSFRFLVIIIFGILTHSSLEPTITIKDLVIGICAQVN